jgi:branched-subunit amino acid aminotransferase/4-amino-4-deoxychorismate lyase
MTTNDNYIILNGDLRPASKPALSHNNRSFLYGDGLFETMHACGTEIQLANSHFQRLYRGMNVLKMEVDNQISQHKITSEISRLLQRMKLFKGTRIRLTVFRNADGHYAAKNKNCSYIIECTPLEYEHYNLNHKGLTIEIFSDISKPIGILSPYKTANSLIYVMAGIYSYDNGFDDVFILNEKGNIIESSHSNLFVVKNNLIYTPPIEEGCIAGVMRDYIINIAKQTTLQISDKTTISENILLDADEIFLTNAIEGIRWVGAFRNRRYFSKTAQLLCSTLNKKLFYKDLKGL